MNWLKIKRFQVAYNYIFIRMQLKVFLFFVAKIAEAI